jgi:glutathione S-transferase
MLTIYYSPGACPSVPHIAFAATGAYLKVNRRGKIPALHTDEGLLTENVAIRPTSPARFRGCSQKNRSTRCISHMAYLSNTVHPAFSYIVRPVRFATDEAAHDNLTATGRGNAWKLLE